MGEKLSKYFWSFLILWLYQWPLTLMESIVYLPITLWELIFYKAWFAWIEFTSIAVLMKMVGLFLK